MRTRRSTRYGCCLPATVRPQGLATLSTAYALRTPAGFVSHRRRSWDSPFGAFPSRKVAESFPNRTHPHTVQPGVAPAAEAPGRPDGPRFPGFDPCKSPSRMDMGLARRPLDTPLGFALLGLSSESLAGDFAPTPLTRLAQTAAMPPKLPAPQSLNRLSLGQVWSRQRITNSAQGNPSRVSAPARSRPFERSRFRAMGSPLAALRITAD
jgi:hypothetical protein